MAETNEKVMALVERELEQDPDASVKILYGKAVKVSADIGKLSHRQFHARYPLQVKRRKSQSKRGERKRRRSTRSTRSGDSNGAQREKIRKVFLDFASDLTAAEERKELVSLVAGIDRYVDRVLKTVG